MTKDKPISKIIIVGAGPSGLLLGILLAKQNIHVTLLDAGVTLDANPRAAHYAPSAVHELRRAGVLDTVKAQGFHPDGVCWREFDGTHIAGIKSPDPPTDDQLVVLPLDRLGKVLLKELLAQKTAEVKWEHKVTGIEQDEHEARVFVEVAGEDGVVKKETYGGDYVVGCDGANSQVRRSLFGDLNYPGETLESQIVATNVYYDFHKFGYIDAQFIVHPENWYMAARITPDGLWRVTYGDKWGLSTEEYIARQPARYEEILPGNPKPGSYKMAGISPYKLHQRCAESFRVGRFLLAADAAHLCNPFGGLGLTGGIADVGSLFDCLMGIQDGLTDESILDKYSEIRRKKWAEIVDPMSRSNFRRLWAEDAVPEKEEFFQMCRELEGDQEKLREASLFTHVLREDFSQYFTKAPNGKKLENGNHVSA